MKIFHISDLHIGKHLHFYSLAQEQRAILNQIVEKTKEYRPDVIVIAGDIYDKSVPSGEAYRIFDDFRGFFSGEASYLYRDYATKK